MDRIIDPMVRLALALFAVQAGFHGFTASLPVALSRAGVPDPQIGLIVGTAALVQIPAALVVGVVLDRIGGLRVFTIGGIAYLVGCAILLLPGVEPGGPDAPFLIARVFQGIGLAATLPSALSLVPRLVAPDRMGFGIGFVASAHNLTLVLLPPISLAILAATSLHGVAAAMIGFVLFGLALVWFRPLRLRSSTSPDTRDGAPRAVAVRRFGFALRRSWAPILAAMLLYIAHWGVVIAYLPQTAEAAGADIGLFFVADGIAIILSRTPSGWLVDRVRPIMLVAIGLAATAGAVVLLMQPLSTPLLIAAGILSGGGGGLVITPLVVELSRRSGDADRGSALALFSAVNAAALVVGSIGAAPVVALEGIDAALGLSLIGIALALVVAVADPALRRAPGPDDGGTHDPVPVGPDIL